MLHCFRFQIVCRFIQYFPFGVRDPDIGKSRKVGIGTAETEVARHVDVIQRANLFVSDHRFVRPSVRLLRNVHVHRVLAAIGAVSAEVRVKFQAIALTVVFQFLRQSVTRIVRGCICLRLRTSLRHHVRVRRGKGPLRDVMDQSTRGNDEHARPLSVRIDGRKARCGTFHTHVYGDPGSVAHGNGHFQRIVRREAVPHTDVIGTRTQTFPAYAGGKIASRDLDRAAVIFHSRAALQSPCVAPGVRCKICVNKLRFFRRGGYAERHQTQ